MFVKDVRHAFHVLRPQNPNVQRYAPSIRAESRDVAGVDGQKQAHSPNAQRKPQDSAGQRFTVALSVLTGILSGLVPALDASRVDLHATLKEGSSRSGSS